MARRTAVWQEELVASVDTVGRAIKIIKKEMNKNPTYFDLLKIGTTLPLRFVGCLQRKEFKHKDFYTDDFNKIVV